MTSSFPSHSILSLCASLCSHQPYLICERDCLCGKHDSPSTPKFITLITVECSMEPSDGHQYQRGSVRLLSLQRRRLPERPAFHPFCRGVGVGVVSRFFRNYSPLWQPFRSLAPQSDTLVLVLPLFSIELLGCRLASRHSRTTWPSRSLHSRNQSASLRMYPTNTLTLLRR